MTTARELATRATVNGNGNGNAAISADSTTEVLS